MAKLSAMRETLNAEDKREGGDEEDRTGLSGNSGAGDNKSRGRRSKSKDKDDGKIIDEHVEIPCIVVNQIKIELLNHVS